MVCGGFGPPVFAIGHMDILRVRAVVDGPTFQNIDTPIDQIRVDLSPVAPSIWACGV